MWILFGTAITAMPSAAAVGMQAELYDIALRADGTFDGAQKYLLDYVSSPNYEPGYVNCHVDNLEVGEIITNSFKNADFDGVRVYSFPQTLENREILEDFDTKRLDESPFTAGDIFAACGIPTTYFGCGICPAVFGENARCISDEVIKNGAILDAVSAKILFEKGVDVGISKINSFNFEIVVTEFFGEEKVLIVDRCRYLDAAYKNSVVPQTFTNLTTALGSLAVSYDDSGTNVLSYRYENEKGQKFFVLNFSLEETISKSNLKTSYSRQEQLINAIEWIGGRKLPAKTYKTPGTYVITKRKDNKLLVMVLNLFEDYIKDLKIYLDKKYTKINTIEGNLTLNGDIVVVNGKFSAFSFVAFEVE